MSDQPKTRISLILRLRHPDDAAAWQEFVEIYQPLVYRLARKHGLQEADALDTTQEVLARVAKAVDQWDPDANRGSFRGWLSRITRNLVIDFLRSKKRGPLTSDDTVICELVKQKPDASKSTLPESELFALEQQRQIFSWAAERVKDCFQPKSWQAFWRTAVEQQSVDEVARQLDLTKGAVYVARSRVMAKLKKEVRRHLENQDEAIAQFEKDPGSERSQR